MYIVLRKIVAVVLAVVCTCSVATTNAHAAVYQSQAVLDQADEYALNAVFDSTIWAAGRRADGNRFVAGSGVLIDPYWVLSAGHVGSNSGNTPWSSMQIGTTSNVLDPNVTFTDVKQTFIFEGYDPSTTPAGQGNDLMLIQLETPIFGIDPAVVYNGGDDLKGLQFSVAGYGYPGIWPEDPGVEKFDGIKRAGDGTIDCIGCLGPVNSNYFLTIFDTRSDDPLPFEWMGSDFDSGGGWYADIGGQMQLISLTNFGIGNDTTGGINLALYDDWITSTMAENSVPEPSTSALLGIGILGMLGMRRRRRNIAA